MCFHQLKKIVYLSSFIIVVSTLSACSNTSANLNTQNPSASQKTSDSLEKYNRSLYRFNMVMDKHLLKPIAVGYTKITPEIVDTSITNFFSNLGDIGNATNNLLQFKFGEALIDTERFIFNSSFGVGGLFDFASMVGMQKHDEDFGQTLAAWGVESGPYVMLPFFGPSTVRDATAKFSIDTLLDPTNYSKKSLEFFALKSVDKRADLISTEEAFKDFSDDKYIALRDAWLQRREYLLSDGKIETSKQSDLIDELEDLDDE